MVYGHFFGLLSIAGYFFILLFFLPLQEADDRKAFLKNICISAVTILILLLPAADIFIQSLQLNESWIAPPANDAFSAIFKDFFGNSEVLVALYTYHKLFYYSF
jgi:hypothetical protein